MVNKDNFWDEDRSTHNLVSKKDFTYPDSQHSLSREYEYPITKDGDIPAFQPQGAQNIEPKEKPSEPSQPVKVLDLLDEMFQKEMEQSQLLEKEQQLQDLALKEQERPKKEYDLAQLDQQEGVLSTDPQFAPLKKRAEQPAETFYKKDYQNTSRNKNGGQPPFSQVSSAKRLCFALLVIFVVSWCFYLGFSYAGVAAAQSWEGYYISGKDLESDAGLADLGKSGIKTILMVGCDKREFDSGRTDTIMLAFVNLDNESVKILSIPRDTYVTIPTSGSKTKINHAYAYGGIPLTERTIEDFLGIKINNYIEIDFEGFADVVEALGGITIDVDMRMYTPWENIDLQPGRQLLNGENALAYVRYREHIEGDIGRVDRQQKFISALANEMFASSNILKLPKIINVAMEKVNTDLTIKEALALGNFIRKTDASTMELFKLPGEAVMIGGISYWSVSEGSLPDIVDYVTGTDESPQDSSSPADTQSNS
ncbi:MAG: LCP family protein [Bacillota bacterium]|jgi:LCP family protein required for cell wall assembly